MSGKIDGTGTEMAGGKRSAWMMHVKKTMRAHKGKSLSAVLKMASKTFKKTRKGMRGGGASSAGPGASTAGSVGGQEGGRRRRRGTRSRRGGVFEY
jgi:hypothetical protein